MIYRVAITETKRRLVAVEANTQTEAHRRVTDAWHNGEVMLDENDFEGIEVYVLGEKEDGENLFKVERKD